MRDKPFVIRVLRFDPKSVRGDAPVKYVLHLWDDADVAKYVNAAYDETFVLRDDLHDVDLLCVRQGPISAGVGARALSGGDRRG